MEQKLGRFAIPNLMRVLIVLYAIGAVISVTQPMFFLTHLSLNFEAVAHGQVWRLITFLTYPIDQNPFFIILMLYIYYIIGVALERIWGSFKFNVFIFSGILCVIFGALIAHFVFHVPNVMIMLIGNTYLNLSLFIAFALSFPDQTFLFFFVLPIKAKYLAYLDLFYFALALINGGAGRIEALSALANLGICYLLFFGTSALKDRRRRRTYQEKMRRAGVEPSASRRRDEAVREEMKKIPKHRCCVCGITDIDHPEKQFRYCSKCNGMYEYCEDHIHNHTHVE